MRSHILSLVCLMFVIACVFSMPGWYLESYAEESIKPIQLPQKVIPRQIAGWNTLPFQQWVTVNQVFPRDESPSLVIHCKGKIGVVGDWKTETICWPDICEHQAVYTSISINTRTVNGLGSGPVTTENKYWGIDVNKDEIDDLIVIEWTYGETKEDAKSKNNNLPYEIKKFDKPKGLRIITRKSSRDSAPSIRSDKYIEWDSIKKSPDIYREYLRQVLKLCKEPKWKQRIEKMLTEIR